MFCAEPIIHVYQRSYYEGKEQPWHNAVFRLTGSFEYHATDGYLLVFQTEHADANTTNAIYAHQIARARAEASGVRAGVFSVLREA